jgi:hypothetical protein
MQVDVIPYELPKIRKEDFPQENLNDVINGFLKSSRKIIMYESDDGQFVLAHEGLDDTFYAGFITSLSENKTRHIMLYNFLKLCLEGTRLVKQCTRKAFQTAVKIGKVIKNGTLYPS